ncbi:tetratricopeptide repeat protein [Gimesia fumaroli]|uniref:Tetratricopeptide repeat protein n=1 Tax=Gimesia fumaroli TaxID=2527976 RepID=A0A518IGZ2_9PLAN|nr:tetratricopeptide repeat protein [Gimesia fumaroli]QDV52358.1 tetratricopeptide repeat protein [Gimesia fumaroli]
MTSQVKESQSSDQKTRRPSRIIVAGLCIGIVVAGLLWRKTAWINFCQWQAERNLQSRDAEQALSWISQAYQADTQNPETLLILARAYRRAHEVEPAIKTLKQLFKVAGPSEELHREQWLVEAQVGDVSNLEKHLADMLIDPKGNAQDICETFVNSCVLNYRFHDAMRIIEVWQADFPNDPLPHYYLGRILEHQGDWEKAAREFSTALEVSPGHIPSAYNLARVNLSHNQVDAALDNYRLCTKYQKEHAAALVGIARCLRMKQDSQAARATLKTAQQVPESQRLKDFRAVGDPAYVARNAILLELGQLELTSGNYKAAVAYLEDAIEQNPKDRKARLALADAYRGSGELEKAEQQIQIVQKTQQAIKRLDECFDLLQKDLENADLRAEIGQIFLEHISENQGVVWLKNALYYDPRHQRARQALEEYYAKQRSSSHN